MTALEAVPQTAAIASQARHGRAVWTREQGPLPPSVAMTPTPAQVESVLFTGLPKERE